MQYLILQDVVNLCVKQQKSKVNSASELDFMITFSFLKFLAAELATKVSIQILHQMSFFLFSLLSRYSCKLKS